MQVLNHHAETRINLALDSKNTGNKFNRVAWTEEHDSVLKQMLIEDGSKRMTVKLEQNMSKQYPSTVQTGNFLQHAEYWLGSQLKFSPGETKPSESTSQKVNPTLEMRMLVGRKIGFWDVVIPLTSLTIVSFAAFFVEAQDLHDRCAITLTTLLAAVSYKYMIAEKMPKINYLTFIDKYIVFNFSSILVVVLENVVAKVSLPVMNHEYWLVPVLVFIYVAILAGFVIRVLCRRPRSYKQVAMTWESKKDTLWVGPLDESPDDQLQKCLEEEASKVCSQPCKVCVVVWHARDAREHCEKYEAPFYPFSHRFAILHFPSEELAEEAMLQMDGMKVNWATAPLQVEPLLPAWRVLFTKKTLDKSVVRGDEQQSEVDKFLSVGPV